MKIVIHQANRVSIAQILSNDVLIKDVQDVLDLMADCGYQGANRIVIHEKNINLDFFDLKTRFAGEILQKFSNYDVKLAIIGDFSRYTSKSLKDFIFESNRYARINFVSSMDEAIARLAN